MQRYEPLQKINKVRLLGFRRGLGVAHLLVYGLPVVHIALRHVGLLRLADRVCKLQKLKRHGVRNNCDFCVYERIKLSPPFLCTSYHN
jgi:hypothetical protein